MDGQRFDALAKAMAGGSTRRGALRLAGGGLAGALLAAAGLGRRAGAQENRPRLVNCQSGLFYEGERYDYLDLDDHEFHKPCGPAHGCHEGKVCVALVVGNGPFKCRCLEL